jgi:hypothetical protein
MILFIILLFTGYQDSVNTVEIFDNVIPNGVLITQSEDDIQMTKHIWRAYIAIPQPTRPTGLQRNVKLISDCIDKIYIKSYFIQTEMKSKKAKLSEAVTMFQKFEIEAKFTKTSKGEQRFLRKLIALEFDDENKDRLYRDKRGLFNFIGDAMHSIHFSAQRPRKTFTESRP